MDPASVASGASAQTTVTVVGVKAAQKDKHAVLPTFSNSQAGLELSGYVSGDDTVTVTLSNPTGAGVDLASGTLGVFAVFQP